MEPLALEKEIGLERAIRESVMVEGDEMRLQQAVVNLFDNAIKYTPRGGQIGIKVGAGEGRAILELKDSGMGISAQALPHIFERFYRSPQIGTAAIEGTGLGLAMVKSIIEAHGGHVSVRSRENEGTQVCVDLMSVK